MKRCKNCNFPLKKEWNYCPNCGSEIEKWYDKVSYGLDDILMHVIKDIQNLFIKNVLKVEVKPIFPKSQNHTHHPITTNKNPQIIPQNQKFLRNVENIIEPETSVIKGEDFIEVEMNLKGVKNTDDVYVVLYDNSAEIRAYTKDNKTMYFKIIEIPAFAEITDKVLKDDDKLILRFEVIDDDYSEDEEI